ncbi:hypothetical protein LX16_0419 [Stackebrandtia albiflava]|uniref:RHIM domain-containing protein n=1 Tax=Stackebrandtia albiflava TaxID=406432 RepID=A0A562VA11_9ACTN|nr:hypothetical protein [Stackebrandtia albiflava]TWJ14730.1 hypothetical protein LX16_0419 [Stackebrandtia albiflava]
MSELELISTALAAGAGAIGSGLVAGVSETASAVVVDAYHRLKALLGGGVADEERSGEILTAEETDPGVWETRLRAAGVTVDEEAVELARRLLSLTGQAGKYRLDLSDAKGVQVGDGNTQHNSFH